MFSINTNSAAMQALQSLQQTSAALNETQKEIATGQKVSSAADNPAVYSISNTMNANLAGLAAVEDGLAFGQSTVAVAMSSASQISSQLASLQNTVTQAQQGGISPVTMGLQITAIIANINQIAGSANFNGVNLLNNSGNLSVIQDIAGNQISVAGQNATSTGLGLTGIGVNSAAVNFAFGAAFAVANADTVTLSNGLGGAAAKSWTFEFSDGSAALTTTPTPTNTVYAVQVDPTTQSSGQMVGALVTAMQQAGFGASIGSDGSLTVGGNSITSAASADVFASTGVTKTAVTGAAAAVAIVTSAVAMMNTISAALGASSQTISSMQNFSSSLQTSLTSGLGALTDADMAAESAKLTSLQTKQQLGIQALSLANQQPQALLTLFR
jgi:flagellin